MAVTDGGKGNVSNVTQTNASYLVRGPSQDHTFTNDSAYQLSQLEQTEDEDLWPSTDMYFSSEKDGDLLQCLSVVQPRFHFLWSSLLDWLSGFDVTPAGFNNSAIREPYAFIFVTSTQ